MQLLRVFVPLLAVVLPALATAEPPADLVIDSVSKPAECTVLAQAGDAIQVHYTGTLFSNGNKFDSRYVLQWKQCQSPLLMVARKF